MDRTDEMLDDIRRMRGTYPPEARWQRVRRLCGLERQAGGAWLRDVGVAIGLITIAIVIGLAAPGRTTDHVVSNSVLVLAVVMCGTVSAKSAILAGVLAMLVNLLVPAHWVSGLYHALTCILAVGIGIFIAYLLDSKRLRKRRGSLAPLGDDHLHD
jgi:hypothetical protein